MTAPMMTIDSLPNIYQLNPEIEEHRDIASSLSGKVYSYLNETSFFTFEKVPSNS